MYAPAHQSFLRLLEVPTHTALPTLMNIPVHEPSLQPLKFQYGLYKVVHVLPNYHFSKLFQYAIYAQEFVYPKAFVLMAIRELSTQTARLSFYGYSCLLHPLPCRS